jgi:uncharacterized tellurite resistance protein B-like protein
VWSVIKDLLGKKPEAASGPTGAQRIQLATAILLLEMAHADKEFHPMEQVVIDDVLADRFQLSPEAIEELTAYATQARGASVDLFQHTRLVNQTFSVDEKIELLHQLWRVVYADGVLHRYEDYLVGRLCTLLRLTHKQLIDAKLAVLDEVGQKNQG